jgi:hypothetical protein
VSQGREGGGAGEHTLAVSRLQGQTSHMRLVLGEGAGQTDGGGGQGQAGMEGCEGSLCLSCCCVDVRGWEGVGMG